MSRSLWIALETQQNALYGSRWKLSRTLSMDRVGNSAERSLWIALETQQNALYGSRWKLSRTLSMDRVLDRLRTLSQEVEIFIGQIEKRLYV
ncbi:hypothetical protein [Leptospira noguchii]|uniref:hypothetical protein n=1 Tax=Leptospira noguchii TaxID=28182 RepID=UPI000F08DBDE